MEKLTTKEKVQIALDRLNDGIRDFFQGDHYKEYLAAMSKLHHYSARNCILIERLDKELGLELRPEEVADRENLTTDVKQVVADAGIKAENVVMECCWMWMNTDDFIYMPMLK